MWLKSLHRKNRLCTATAKEKIEVAELNTIKDYSQTKETILCGPWHSIRALGVLESMCTIPVKMQKGTSAQLAPIVQMFRDKNQNPPGNGSIRIALGFL